AGALQPLANLADAIFIYCLPQLFFLLAAEFDQVVHQLRLAPRFPRNLQTSQCSQLHVQIAHLPGALADSAQQLQKFFLTAVELWRKLAQQYLQAARARAEAVYVLCPWFRGKLDQVLLKLLKNNPAALWRDRHKKKRRIESGDENTALPGKRQPLKSFVIL